MPDETPAAALMRLVNGYQVSQAIAVAAELGLADLLADGPRTADELAASAGAHPGALYRLLRALAAVGVFREASGRSFALTPMAECLRAAAADSVGPWARLVARPYLRRAWDGLEHSIRTGRNAFSHVHGTDVWSYRRAHDAEGAVFDGAMAGISRRVAVAVAAAYDFGGLARIVDVGGGDGTLLARIMVVHGDARGVLFDRPAVVARAAAVLAAAGVADRCDVVGGDFFAALPQGADAYILKAILHDWPDAPAVAILRRCREAMRPGARLLVIERLVGPPNEGAEAKFSDLNMLVVPGGRERTGAEFATLLADAGFAACRVIPTGTRMSVIEAAPD